MKKPRAALSPRAYPRSVAWRVDVDYAKNLSPEDRAWLASFLDRHYGADFRGEGGPQWTADERRAAYRDKNAANRDVMTQCVPSPSEPEDRTVDFDDLEPADDFDFDGPVYKAARDAYRRDPSPANRVRLSRARTKK